jgi:DNA-binding CsgD family transcriptional regulator
MRLLARTVAAEAVASRDCTEVAVLRERSQALTALEAMQRDSARTGRIALLAGEAGIGKTALVQAFAERMSNRARVLVGLCDPLGTPRASGPLHDIARECGGLLAERLAARSSQADLFVALVEELSGPRQRPGRVVVIEDAHWADEATHDLIVFLGRRIERLAGMLIVTYRDDEIGPEHPLRATLAALPRQAVQAVPVTTLSRQCVAEQAARVGREPGELYELTGGNPLLLTELLASDGRAVPTTVKDLVLARLRRLSAAARDVARLISVMPAGADAVVLGGLAEPVDECIAAGVLVPVDGRVSYRHELLRHAVEDSLSPARRVTLHRRVLALLAPIPGTDPSVLVHHARHAGDVTALLRFGVTAAIGAAARGAHRESVAHFRVVRPYAHRLGPAERAGALERYGVEAYLAGEPVEGLSALRAAQVVRGRLGDPVRIGENYRWISRLAWWCGNGAEARRTAEMAVEVLEAAGPSRELALAYSHRSQLHVFAHELVDAVLWGERARDLGDAEPRVHPTAAASEAVERAACTLAFLASSTVLTLNLVGADALVDDAIDYATAHDLEGYVQYLLGVRALLRFYQCDWDAALADADDALDRPNRVGVAVVSALVARGRIQTARDLPDALSTLDRAAEMAYGTGEIQRIGPVASARAEYFLLHDNPERAAEEARRGLTLARSKGQSWIAGELAYWVWRATGVAESPATQPTPHHLLMAGDWQAAAQAWASRHSAYSRLEALSTGDRTAVTEALRILSELGAVRVAKHVRADLRRRGVTAVPRGPRPTTASNVAGLTTRQFEVLGMLVDGLTNADIASRLTLSHKTVEHHVSAVLDKLNVASRGQAIAAAHRLNLAAVTAAR